MMFQRSTRTDSIDPRLRNEKMLPNPTPESATRPITGSTQEVKTPFDRFKSPIAVARSLGLTTSKVDAHRFTR